MALHLPEKERKNTLGKDSRYVSLAIVVPIVHVCVFSAESIDPTSVGHSLLHTRVVLYVCRKYPEV
jgi:hypothetical protein